MSRFRLSLTFRSGEPPKDLWKDKILFWADSLSEAERARRRYCELYPGVLVSSELSEVSRVKSFPPDAAIFGPDFNS